MEIQVLEHNELSVRYNFLEKNKETQDQTLGSKYSSFRADLKPHLLVRGTCHLIFCSLPPIMTILTVFFQNFVNVYYVASTQNQVLINAFGAGLIFLNVFGYNIIFALNNNLIALISQSHGARDPYAVGVHFQRGLVFQIPIFCILLIAMFFADKMLYLVGLQIDDDVMIEARQFVEWSAISVLFSGIYDVGRIYLCGLNHFGLPFYIKVVITLINAGLADALIEKQGLVGLAIARNVGEFVGLILLYVFISKQDLRSWIPPTIKMWTKWWDYFKFIFPGGLSLYLHYLYMGILTIFVFNLHEKPTFSAHVSFINLRPLLFAIPLGTSVTVTSFIGQAVGENSKKKAQTASLMGVITCNIYFLIQMAVGYWVSAPLKKFLSIQDEYEIVQFDIIFNLYIFFIIYLESHQFMFTGIMKGLGQLSYNLKFYIFGFYIVGIPLTYCLIKFTDLQLKGIWISYLISNLIVCVLQIMFFIRKEWDDFLAQKGIDLDNEIEIPFVNYIVDDKDNAESSQTNEHRDDGINKLNNR